MMLDSEPCPPRPADLIGLGQGLADTGLGLAESISAEPRPWWTWPKELIRNAVLPQTSPVVSGSVWATRRLLRFETANPVAGALFRLFTPGQSVDAGRMGGVPSALLHQLASSGIASEENGRWLATFRIVPVQGVFVLVDRPSRLPELGNAWVQFGIDTIQLASMIVHEARGGGRALDLCTGSGIQALLPSKRYAVTEGTDINPRAIAMAEANAAINGVGDRLQFWQGDLYDRAEGTYDLIVANPPFMFLPPDVAQTNLRGSGGALGIEVTLRVLEGLAGRLSEQGEAFTYTQGPRIAGRCQLVEATSRRLSGVPLEVEFEEILRGYWSAYHEFYRSAGVESLTCYRVRVKRASRFSVTVRPLRGWRRAAVSLGVALERWA